MQTRPKRRIQAKNGAIRVLTTNDRDLGKGEREVFSQQTLASDIVLTSDSVAQLLKIARKTLEAWRQRGIGPRFVRYSPRCVRYRLCDVQEWLDRNLVETDS